MADFSYESLLNDNVKFLQGTQAQLSKYFLSYTVPSGEDDIRGTAEEGAFYLTTDTHRLYVGRKIENNTDTSLNGKVIPVQISAGITTVKDSETFNENVLSGNTRPQEGDFYYIESSNILAVYSINDSTGVGKWVQVNPATGITSFDSTITNMTADGAVKVVNTISTAAQNDGTKSSTIYFEAGNNITLTSGTYTGATPNKPSVTISATDTKYNLATTATTVSTNAANIDLVETGSNPVVKTSVILSGTSNIAVSSTTDNYVYIKGIDFGSIGAYKGVAVEPIQGTSGGFRASLEYNLPTGGQESVVHTSKSVFNPIISYGSATPTQAKFLNGTATLDIYTRLETDEVIDQKIADEINAANAMVYRGTISSATAIDAIKNGATGHIGDTYKADTDFTYGTYDIKKGDLIILNIASGESETADGYIPTAHFRIDVVPAGDEPYIVPSYSYNTSNNTAILRLNDSNNGNSTLAGLNIPDTDKIGVNVTAADTATHVGTLTLSHKTVSTTYNSGVNLTAETNTSATDTIGTSKVSLFVLNSVTAVSVDSWGHVTSIEGKQITFEHNQITSVTRTFATVSTTGTSLLTKSNVTLGLYSNIGAYKSVTIPFESESLNIAPNSATNALAINIKWGSF